MNFVINNNGLPVATNQASQMVSNSFEATKPTARLFLFSPRTIPDTCKRSQKYNFNLEFVNDLMTNVDKVNSNDCDLRATSYMNGVNSAVNAVTVDAQGETMNNRVFNTMWTFLLQIDNEQLKDSPYGDHNLANRFIYSGFCCTEPVSMLDGIRVTINPNCVLKITHSTSMSKQQRFTAAGDVSRMLVNSDIDYIPGDVTMQLNGNVNYYLSPRSIIDSIGTSGNDPLLNGQSALSRFGSKPIPMDSSFNSPKHHLHSIVNSVLMTYDNMITSDISNGSIHPMSGDKLWNVPEMTTSSFISNIPNLPSIPLLSLDGRNVYTLGDLQNKYPYLEVYPITAEKVSENDLANQSTVSRANMASSIIVGTVPMIMNDAGLCEIAFFYESFTPNSIIVTPNMEGNFKILNVAPWAMEDTRITKMRLRSVLSILKEQVFPIVKNIGGDFDLSVSCTAAGECDCFLTYLDDANGTQGIYESPLLLGGLNTSMVGNESVMLHNCSHMEALKGILASELPNRLPSNGLFTNMSSTQPIQNPLDTVFTPNESIAQATFGTQTF